MNLIVLGSSSSGNGYILTNGEESFIIECGMKFLDVKKEMDFNITSIKGCVVSHQHEDHSKYISEYLQAGIKVLSSVEVFDDAGELNNPYAKIVQPLTGYKAGGFSVIPFPLAHDVPCLGFIINHKETGNILFITDSFLCEYTFPGINNIILEINYADDILQKAIDSGGTNPVVRNRLMTSHMELETAKGILIANDLSNVMNIVLCHLSNGHSDEKRFIKEVVALTGKQVYAASKGLKIPFNKDPF